ncbi:Signal transduction histidine kinase [Pseudarcicella hirudinis]|uniref:histidine kinase n=1 Tax=Pseudarcicella hirudinis TaxID=1079859 RepID=A0A1I5X4C7_9BACT|nr:ATP-binding protein [Pseudarcicella hirudinis]SFQ26833.1 Signal transduction histidine kinase [Pseudarcicella hirudinis]
MILDQKLWLDKTTQFYRQTTGKTYFDLREQLEDILQIILKIDVAEKAYFVRCFEDFTAVIVSSSDLNILNRRIPMEYLNDLREINYKVIDDVWGTFSFEKNPKRVILQYFDTHEIKGFLVKCYGNEAVLNQSFKYYSLLCKFRIEEVLQTHQNEHDLNELKIRFESILRASPMPIIFVDDLTKGTFINDKGYDLLEIDRNAPITPEIISSSFARLIKQLKNKAEVEQQAKDYLIFNQDKAWPWRLGSPHNRTYNVITQHTNLKSYKGRLWIFEDISIEETTKEQLQNINQQLFQVAKKERHENTLKSAFLSNMSHEIRTPLNGVIGAISILEETPLTKEQYELVNIIKKSGEGLISLINDILDYSKIEAGELKLQKESFSIIELVDDCVDIFYVKGLERNIEIRVIFDKRTPVFIYGDKNRIKQIILNLLSNAVKFSRANGIITIEVETAVNEKGENILVCKIIDCGDGIPEEMQSVIFERFTQINQNQLGGTGLGLAICKRLTEMMGGQIGLESVFDFGSTFFFSLPLSFEGNPPLYLEELLSKYSQVKSCLWAVESEDGIEPFARYVENSNLKLIASADPEELVNGNFPKPNIILIDTYILQDKLASAIRLFKNHPVTGKVPIVLVSYPNNIYLKELDSSSYDEQLMKPLKLKSLVQILDKIILGTGNVPKPETEQQDSTQTYFGNRNILVVEDNLFNQKIIKHILDSQLDHFDMVESGEEAVSMVSQKLYDLIFMDIQLPGMDGVATTKIIREIYAMVDQPTIIALTADIFMKESSSLEEAGFDDYIPKPYRKKEIITKLEEYLVKK